MQSHERWLKKAESDLRLAKIGLANCDTLDSAIFHTQQCAEKSLKAYLAYKKQLIRKTHDLEFLVTLCGDFDPDFLKKFLTHADILNPYCFEFRYPADDDDSMVPDFDEVQKAIELAEEIYVFVVEKII